jgi:hypothetical protein
LAYNPVSWNLPPHWKPLSASTNSRKELTAASQPAFKKLVADLQQFRHPLAADLCHAPFRAKPEGWLEFLVREDITRIDACFDPRFVYTQV